MHTYHEVPYDCSYIWFVFHCIWERCSMMFPFHVSGRSSRNGERAHVPVPRLLRPCPYRQRRLCLWFVIPSVEARGYRCTFGPVRGTARSGVCGPRAARPVAGPGHGPHPRPAARWWPMARHGPLILFYMLWFYALSLWYNLWIEYVLLETMKLYAASFICCDLWKIDLC